MSFTTRLITGSVLAAALAAAAPHAAQADERVLSVEQRETPVAAWDGTVAWSHYDAATRSYRLMLSRDGGAPRLAPIASNPKPFDVDLGTNRGGSTYAVYTRGGDLYRMSVASGAEQRLSSLSDPKRAERDPTIARGRIAFVRRVNGADELRVGDTTHGSRGTTRLTRSGSISMPELTWNRVAYVQYDRALGWGRQRVRVLALRGGKDRIVYTARSGGANYADLTDLSGTDDGRFLTWARTNLGSGRGNRLIRYSFASGRLAYAQGRSTIGSTAWAGRSLGMATAGHLTDGECFQNIKDPPEKSLCKVTLINPVSWTAGP